MKKFEYLEWTAHTGENVTRNLRVLGDGGWELVTALRIPGYWGDRPNGQLVTVFYFKREIVETTKRPTTIFKATIEFGLGQSIEDCLNTAKEMAVKHCGAVHFRFNDVDLKINAQSDLLEEGKKYYSNFKHWPE